MKKFKLELNGDVIIDQEDYLEDGFMVNIISKNFPPSVKVAESDRHNLILITSSKDASPSNRSLQELQVGDHISLTINLGP